MSARIAGYLAGPLEPSEPVNAEVRWLGEERAWELRSAHGRALAGIEHGAGVLWWLEVHSTERGRGHGRSLLRQARRLLLERGAEGMLLVVDDDPTKRDRRPALALYESEGAREVDRLRSYRRPEPSSSLRVVSSCAESAPPPERARVQRPVTLIAAAAVAHPRR